MEDARPTDLDPFSDAKARRLCELSESLERRRDDRGLVRELVREERHERLGCKHAVSKSAQVHALRQQTADALICLSKNDLSIAATTSLSSPTPVRVLISVRQHTT